MLEYTYPFEEDKTDCAFNLYDIDFLKGFVDGTTTNFRNNFPTITQNHWSKINHFIGDPDCAYNAGRALYEAARAIRLYQIRKLREA